MGRCNVGPFLYPKKCLTYDVILLGGKLDKCKHMTYTGGSYSQEALLRELAEKVRTENVETFGAYKDLVDSLVEEKKSYGFFTDEEDLEQLKRNLESQWEEIENLHEKGKITALVP